MPWILLMLAACVAYPDGAGLLEARAHDTTLDRVRVLGVRATPDVPVWGAPFTLDVLALGPDGAPPLLVDGCAWDAPRPVRDATCFGVPELVSTLGSAAPLEVTRAPFASFPQESCADLSTWTTDTGASGEAWPPPDCVAPLHLRVTATDADGTDAVVLSIPSADATYPPPSRLPVGDLTLTTSPGDSIEIEGTLPLPDDWLPASNADIVARWYASTGVYLGTGRTTGVVDGGNWRTMNHLALDADATGTVQVVVVAEVRRGIWTDQTIYESLPRTEMRWAMTAVVAP